MSGPKRSFRLIRRIRCGHLEALIVATRLDDGHPRYGVVFQRDPTGHGDPNQPFFDLGELLTVAKLARVAHDAVRSLVDAED
jgi:hypothetical protein